MTRRRMYLRMVTKSFLKRIPRALVALLSIITGSATLAALLLLAYTVPAQISHELRSYGANLVLLPATAERLDIDDLVAIDQQLSQAEIAVLGRAPYRYGNVLYNQQPISAMGTSLTDSRQVRSYWKIDGQYPSEGEILVGDSVASRFRFGIGDAVALMASGDAGGHTATMTVSGILRTGGAEDELIVMSDQDLAAFLGGDQGADVIEFSIGGDSADLRRAAEVVDQASPDGSAEIVRRISESEAGIARTLRSLIWLVSGIISVLTLIGVSTTMASIVTSRSREIGLRKALGAFNRSILVEFVGEALMLGVVGGVMGATAGVWIAQYVTRQAFAIELDTAVAVWPITVAFAALVSVAGSLVPTRRIARINPASVLGGE